MLDTPVLFIVFNRADTTRQVFEAIRLAKPKQLFVAADGPRADKEGEKEKCDAVRKIATAVDWDCDVRTLFRDNNLGCGKNVSQAISWFFSIVKSGIILEDDTLPSQPFFKFCQDMLNKYEFDESVMHIGGINFDFFNDLKKKEPYFFSNIVHVWGWATWSRAWDKYDFNLMKYHQKIELLECDESFKKLFFDTYLKKIDTWDYQWMFSVLSNNSKSIIPKNNLVENIGFGLQATHTKNLPIWTKYNKAKNLDNYKNDFLPNFYPEYEKIVIKNTIESKFNIIEKIRLRIKK